jgi:GNAT superfamily N-acetyltransferase
MRFDTQQTGYEVPIRPLCMSEIQIVNLEPQHFEALERLQVECYPTLGEGELMRIAHFESHYRLFREGQFVALEDGKVIGQGSGFYINFDFDHPGHKFREICAEQYFTNHDPDGEYYYGADISVHPHHRGRGVGKLIYAERMALVTRCNRRGIVAGGVIPGYARYRGLLTPHEYVSEVQRGNLQDSTLTFQLRMGFSVRGMLANYLEDSASDNWATLIEWANPAYVPTAQVTRAAKSKQVIQVKNEES